MTDYTKSTNFAAKDALTKGDPNKTIKGAELDTEFNSLQSASSTKANLLSGVAQGNLLEASSTGGLQDSGFTVETVVGKAAPTGTVLMFGAASAPSGFLLCDGSAVSRNTYADLFAVIGTTFGNGDAASTFNLPDLRGRAGVGMGEGDDGAGGVLENRTVGETGGEETHELTEAEMPKHYHLMVGPKGGFAKPQDDHGVHSGVGDYGGGTTNDGTNVYGTYSTGGDSASDSTAPNDTSVGDAHNVMQPFTVLNFIIKT